MPIARPKQPLILTGRVIDGGILYLDNRAQLDRALKHPSWQRRVTITIAPEEERRRQKANRFYWVAVIKPIAEHIGYSPDQTHEILKYKFNSELIEMVDPATGEAEELKVPRSTAKLTVADFAVYVDTCVMWAAEFLGIVIEDRAA
jgi:hypothetical protein